MNDNLFNIVFYNAGSALSHVVLAKKADNLLKTLYGDLKGVKDESNATKC